MPRRPLPTQPRSPRTASWPLRPLHWLQSLLRRRLRVERRGWQLHVLLEAPPSEQEASPAGGEALRRAHGELRVLLNRHADARRMMRHLGYIERALARSGSRALRKIPTPVLRKGLEQLELLVRDADGAGLAPLRTRLEEILGRRPRELGEPTRPQAVHMSEATHSLFDEVERSWTGKIPLDEPPPAPPARG
jgi:hypothetical protein